MTVIVLSTLLLGSLILNIYQLTHWTELKELVQQGVDKAERTKNGWVKMPLNEVMKLGFACRHGGYAWPERPWRDPKELRRKEGPHPATLRPSQREKL
jgi:hypothetical protein